MTVRNTSENKNENKIKIVFFIPKSITDIPVKRRVHYYLPGRLTESDATPDGFIWLGEAAPLLILELLIILGEGGLMIILIG